MTVTTAADLRTVVARRVGTNRKVALLGGDAVLTKLLQGNGCDVLADPESVASLAAFGPAVVVAFDGFARGEDPGGAFAELAASVPDAELVFSFANAASSSALLQALVGKRPPLALSEPDVTGWLRAAGLEVTSRDVVIGPHQPTGLAVDAEAQLRQVLEQLNPDAGAERLLLVAKRAGRVVADREPGLLTVIVTGTNELQATLGALGGQPQRPLQVIVAASADVETFARPHAEKHGFALERVVTPSADFAARTNAAVPRARGQYLAFLEAGDTVERIHFRQALKSLEAGTSAWAIAGVAQAGAAVPDAAFALPAWLAAGQGARCGLVLDRDRLGPFPLTFAEGVAEAEPLFLARLAALFPAITLRGAATVTRPTPRAPFDARALAEAMKARPLRAIGPLVLATEAAPARGLDRWLKSKLGSGKSA